MLRIKMEVQTLLLLVFLGVSFLAVIEFNNGLWRLMVNPFCRLSLPVSWSVADSAPAQSGYSRFESGPLGFSYPTAWQISSQVWQGGEILYHTDFREPGRGAHGFVQIWRLEKPLNQFIDEAEHSSIKGETIAFKRTAQRVAGRPGCLLEYRRQSATGEEYLAREVFFKEGQRLYRLSYFVSAKANQKRHEQIFKQMVDSLRLNQ